MSTLKTSNLQHASAASPAIVLAADGSATLNGLAFPTSGSLSGRNRIINGDMRIDQRNAGAAATINLSTFAYTIDRWYGYGQSSDGVFTVQRSTTATAGFTNSALITVTTADASIGATQLYGFGQKIEGFNISDLGWGTANAQPVTLSFRVRSSLTGTFSVTLLNGVSYNRGYTATFTINSANTFETKTITIPGDTTGTWNSDNTSGLDVWFAVGSGSTYTGTAGAWNAGTTYAATGQVNLIGTNGATFYITGVQLEAGTVATPFERRSYGQELALCQRYYQEVGAGAGGVSNGTGTSLAVGIQYPVVLRTNPTVSLKTTTLTAGDVHVAVRTSSGSSIISVSSGSSGSEKGLDFQVNGWTTTANKFHVLYTNCAALAAEL
jgi:hypothetical protein